MACERDLTSGIQDCYPLPVFGILNERPNGPCLDTFVPLDKVEEAIRLFLNTPASQPLVISGPPPPVILPAAAHAGQQPAS